MSDTDSFVRVDAGTYALAEWGHNRVATYPDIIASILKLHNRSLPFSAYFHTLQETIAIDKIFAQSAADRPSPSTTNSAQAADMVSLKY